MVQGQPLQRGVVRSRIIHNLKLMGSTALLMSLLSPASAQDFNCVWSGANADWDESAQWSNCNGGIPNNNASTFSATINSGNVDIDGGSPNLEIAALTLNGGSIDHSSVTLTVKGVATLSGDYNLSNGTLQGGNWVGNVNVVPGANAAIVSTGFDPFSVAGGSTFTIGNNSDLNVNGAIVNNGIFTFDSTSVAVDSFEITDIDLNAATADVTLGGSGAIVLNDNSARIDGGGYLIQQATHSITGVGGINNLTLDNQGTINANVDGGVLVISGTAVNNTGGTVQAENNGAISISDAAQISNGTLSTASGGQIRFAAGTNSALRDVTITEGSQLVIGNNADANLDGFITNDGTITYNSTSTAVDSLEVTDNDINAATIDLTLAGTGNIVLNDNSAAIDGGGYLRQQTGHSVEGFGNINGITLDNEGEINGNNAAGELRLTNVQLNNTGGTIRAENGGAVSVSGNTTIISNGTLSTNSGGEIRFAAGSNSELRDVVITGASQLVIGNNTDANLGGVITNDGTISFNSTTTAVDSFEVTDNDVNAATVDLTLAGTGNVVLNDNSTAIDGGGYILQQTGHSIEGFGNINSITLDNEGEINGNNAVGELRLTNVQLNNTAGTIQAENGGAVSVEGSTTRISNGTLSTTSGGEIRFGSGSNSELRDVTITGGSQLVIGNNTDANLGGLIANNGTITFNSTSTAFDSLEVTDNDVNSATVDLALTGSGNIVLNDNSARIDGNGYFTQGSDHSISGFGSVGVNALRFDTAGLVDANALNQRLLVDAIGGRTSATAGLTNTGTLRASNGGILELQDSRIENSAASITALADSTVELDRVRVDSGTLSSVGTGRLSVTLNTTSEIIDVAITGGSTLEIGNNASLLAVGTIINDGTITYQSISTAVDRLQVDDRDSDASTVDTTLTGTGVVRLNDNSSRIDGNGYLVQTANHSIEGFGRVGDGLLKLDNAGLIDANVNGERLIVSTTGNRFAAEAGLTNSNLLQASNGGILTLQDGYLDNSTGIIQAQNNSTVEIDRMRIDGGTLQSNGDGEFFVVTNQSNIFNDITIANDTSLILGNNTVVELLGDVNNSGAVSFRSISTAADTIRINNVDGNLATADLTLSGDGSITLNDNSNRIDGNGLLVHELTHTIQGFGQIGTNSLNIDNAGLITANVLGEKLLIDAPGTTTSVIPGLTNTGVLEAANGGILELQTARIANTGGIIAARQSSIVQFDAARIEGGSLIGESGSEFFVVENTQSEFVDTAISSGATVVIGNNTDLNAQGLITNNGLVTYRSTSTAIDSFEVQNLDNDINTVDATLAGTGSLVLNDATAVIDGNGLLVNDTGHTIAGFGQIGRNETTVDNRGVITANVSGQSLFVDTAGVSGTATAGLTNSGTLRAENGGSLILENQNITNNGTIEALNGSNVTMQPSAALTNNVAGDLQGGVYRAVSTGNGATVTINGDAITNNSAEIVLSGAGSVFQTRNGALPNDFTQLEDSLTGVSGTLRVLDNRNYTTANSLTITGVVELGGGTLDANEVSNLGEVFGFGTVADPVVNLGLVRASGGNLTATVQDIAGGSTIQIDPDASLTLSGNSRTEQLIHNGSAAGSLNLQTSDLLVDGDYQNANFGSGNSFDGRANVTGSGQILAINGTAQSIIGDVTDGTTASPSISFGNIHVGDTVSRTYQVAQSGTGTSIRGALQTDANGGNITDGNLSGSGVTAQNYGQLLAGDNSGDFTVTYSAADNSGAGALTGQSIAVVNNFDNVDNQVIALEGAAFRFANPEVNTAPIVLGNSHVGDVRGSTVSITNNVANDGFSESLNANVISSSGDASGAGSFNLLAASQTNNSDISVALDTSVAGARTGNVTLGFVSDGSGSSELGQTTLANQTILVAGDVYRFAEGDVAATQNFGNSHVGDVVTSNLLINNVAINDGFSESLNASVNSVTGNVSSNGASPTLIAAGGSNNAIAITLDTSVAGARTGTVNLDFVSDGSGTSELGQTDIADGSVLVTGNVYALANPVVQDSLNFGNVLVGSNQLQAISVLNDLANNDFNEDLNASWNSADSASPPSGIQALLGQIFGLGAGEVDTSSLQVQLDTSSAGVVSATVTVDLESAGAVDGIANGLGITTLPGQPLTVQANIEAVVNNLAAAAVPTTNFSFGNAHVGDAIAQQNVRIENAAQAPAEGLNASIQSAINGAVTNGGSISSLAAETFNDSSIAVGISSASAGAVNGTVTLAFESDGMANNGQTTQLQSRDVQVSGAIYALAAGSINGTAAGQPITIDLGAARVGDTNLSQSVTVTNTGIDSGGFTESLTASVTGVPSEFQINGNGGAGSTTSIVQGSSEDVTVTLATTTSGSFSGNQTVNFSSNEINGSGLGNTALASSDATLTGRIYQTAEASVDRSNVNFGIVHVGDAVTAENITLTNTAGGALVDRLAGSFSTVDGPFFGTGTLGAGLQSGQSATLSLDVDTSTAGIFSGQAGFGLLSQNNELADAAVAAAAISLDIQINEYANAVFEQSGGDGVLNGSGLNYILDFGNVIEGSIDELLAELFISNDTTGPSDVLDGIFDLAGLTAEFMATGFNDFTGIEGGNSFNGLMLAFDTSGLGIGTYNSVINLTPFSRIPGQFNAQQGDITLTIQGRVVNANPVPIPGALLLILLGLVTLRLQHPPTKKSR